VQLPWGCSRELFGWTCARRRWSVVYHRHMNGRTGPSDRWMIDRDDDDVRERSLWAHAAARNIGRVPASEHVRCGYMPRRSVS
jgi:hypothetical protein